MDALVDNHAGASAGPGNAPARARRRAISAIRRLFRSGRPIRLRGCSLPVLSIGLLLVAPGLAGARPPNIVLIVADDLGWKDVGYHQSEIDTPHIDRIAGEGLELDRFYVQPTCSPTRASLMTGKSSLRLGVVRPISKNEALGLPLSERLLPEYLRDTGYQTFMTGKWHLGHVERHYFPHERGFDSFYGHVTGGIGYWDHNHGGGHDWQRDGVTVREQGYSTHLIADEAVRLLAEREPDRPTFLYVAFNAPHLPNEAPDAALARHAGLDSPQRRAHAAMVSELDAAIGRILAALEAEGMRDRTLVWFFSDNGGLNRSAYSPGTLRLVDTLVGIFGRPLPTAALEFLRANVEEGAADNAPLRGGKMTIREGGVRVPAAVWWPGRIEGGRSEAFVSVQDVMPTLLEAAGVSASGLDGTSRLQVLAAGASPIEHADYAVTALGAVALYRGPWKLVLPASPNPFSDPEPELYHVFDDPAELHDRAAEHPDLVAELRAAAEAWPRGPEIHGSLVRVLWDPDQFGGPEDREPWAEHAR
jgi:arylsulfatase A-like enzyme